MGRELWDTDYLYVVSPELIRMSQPTSVAASLAPAQRKNLAIKVLAKNEPLTHLAAREKVSRKFLYQQYSKANTAIS